MDALSKLVPQRPLYRHALVVVAAGVGFYLLTINLSSYNTFELGEIALYAIALAGLSLLTGTNGQISLGHGAFMAVGAYTQALFMTHTQAPLILELLASMGIAAALGLLVGIPATRLKGPHLAGITLLLALSLPLLADKYGSVLGSDQGLTTIPPSAPGNISPTEWLTWMEIFGALVVMFLLSNLMSSRFGRDFRAVRDNEISAALVGVHVARTKVTAFAISAACAGLAGAFLGLSTGVVNTGEFPLTLSIQLLAAMVIGGSGSLVGMWWGAILLVYMPSWSNSFANHFSLGAQVSAYFATIVYGAILIIVIMVAPSGIQGGLKKGYALIRRQPKQTSATVVTT